MSREQAIHLKIVSDPARSSLRLAVQSFMLSREAMSCTPATLVWYRKYLNALVHFLEEQGLNDPHAVTSDLLRRYLVHAQGLGLAPKTIHHHASAARALFCFLHDEGLIPENPMRRVAMPRLPKEIKPAFTPEEVQHLIAACVTSRDKAIVLCLLDSGARASEFCALKVGEMNLATGAVTIRQGKGKKDRVAFLGNKARKALTKYLLERQAREPKSPLWLSERGEALTTWGLRQLLERLGARAGVKPCSPHTFRRTCALWSLRAGMSIYHLQSMLGHSDLSVLRKYLALVEGDLEEAHKSHGAVDHML